MATVTKTIGTASRDYSTITAWEVDLDDTLIYSSGDDIIGECYNDTVFNDRFSLGETTISKNSVTLTVATGERHDGTLGTGVEVYWNNSPGVLLGDLSVTSHATVEWIIFDTEYIPTSLDASYGIRVDVSNYRILNCIFNKKRRNKSIGTPKGIYEYLNGALIANNIIQYWGRTSGVSYTPVSGYAIRKEHSNNNSQYFNNTIWDNYYGISVSGTANTDARNNISQGTALSAYHGTITTEDYNIADDTTTTGTNSINSVSASSLFVSTVFGSEDLHILSGSDADGTGIDLSLVAPSAVYDIDGFDRSTASGWDIGADQLYVAPPPPEDPPSEDPPAEEDDNNPFGTPGIAPPFYVPIWQSDCDLFIKGGPDITEDTTLYIGPEPPIPSEDISLIIDGPPANEIPLVIGKDQSVSGIVPLYVNGVQGFGGDLVTDKIDLHIEGMANNAAPYTSDPATPTLHINGPDFERASGDMPLVIDGTPVIVSSASGSLTFFTSGGSATSTHPESSEQFATLAIRNANYFNQDAALDVPLHIETDFNIGVTTSLYVNSTVSSGVAPLAVDGANITASGISLIVRTPESDNVTLYLNGFRS